MEILTVAVNLVVNGIPVVVLIVADDFLKCCTDVVSTTVGWAKWKTIEINYIILTFNCKVKTIITILMVTLNDETFGRDWLGNAEF